ncbi:MAG TPA: DEAD/DEAH box helicase [Polyangiaceae bacterium]|nr:DEAD/DEAH box helicase [Polyangiaceae bacterium]
MDAPAFFTAATPGPTPTFVARLTLFMERLYGVDPEGTGTETDVPALKLCFDYHGTTIRAADRRDRFFVSTPSGVAMVERDRAGEARAQCLLESFGAVEIGCLESHEPSFDSEADYLLPPDGNVHIWCSFAAYAIPQLRALGWVVEVAPDYPYRVADPESPWYADLERGPDEEREDWFSLELGVEIDGRRVNLLPALLELLDEGGDAASLESLLRVPARFRVLPVGDGRYLPVPPERLGSLLRVVLELYRGERLARGALPLPSSRAGVVSELDAVFATTGARLSWRGDLAGYERGRSLAARPKAPEAATGLRAELRPYQAEGLAWLQHLRAHDAGGILADDMGLGKTLQTIAALTVEKESGRADRPSLVVVPKSLLGNWQRELARFAPGLRVCPIVGPRRSERLAELPSADVGLITYPVLLREHERLRAQEYHYLILDEAQAIKNPRSLAHGAVKALSARHRLCLTGTPVENHLGELWALFDFLMPGFLGELPQFRARYMSGAADLGAERLDGLRRTVSPFILRRMKEHVARELPPKTEIVRPVELDGDQRDLYESIRVAAHSEVRRVIRKKGMASSAIAILDALMKLRQVCCDPRLVTTASAREVARSAKYESFLELVRLQLAQGRRVLVFSQFTRLLALLAQGLEEHGIRYVELTGATTDRQRAVDRFQSGEVDLFLISLKAGGTGLNLTRADTVIHYDPWWNSAAQAQATDRAYRIGQTCPVFVYKLIVAGSVEERMLRLQQKKAQLASTLLGTQSASPVLDEAELDDLFAPLPD